MSATSPIQPLVGPDCWSRDEEAYHSYANGMGYDGYDLEPGCTIWEGYKVAIDVRDTINVSRLLEDMAERAGDECGEAVGDWPDLTKDEKAELLEVIAAWFEKKEPPKFWTVRDVRERALTEEDFV